MIPADIEAGVQAIFASVFRRQDIVLTPELTAADVPGWDSFRYVSLIMAIEERFAIQFSDADIDGLKNVGDLLSAVARKRASPAG
jgi:acyl carrier protein